MNSAGSRESRFKGSCTPDNQGYVHLKSAPCPLRTREIGSSPFGTVAGPPAGRPVTLPPGKSRSHEPIPGFIANRHPTRS